MTDGAVKPAAPAAPALRGRGTASRLVQYILLQGKKLSFKESLVFYSLLLQAFMDDDLLLLL